MKTIHRQTIAIMAAGLLLATGAQAQEQAATPAPARKQIAVYDSRSPLYERTPYFRTFFNIDWQLKALQTDYIDFGFIHCIDELSDLDKQYLKFGRMFEKHFVGQGQEENRTIIQTLDIGWSLLRMLPREELDRIDTKILDEYYDAGEAMQED